MKLNWKETAINNAGRWDNLGIIFKVKLLRPQNKNKLKSPAV
jgi:hypothetical protein